MNHYFPLLSITQEMTTYSNKRTWVATRISHQLTSIPGTWRRCLFTTGTEWRWRRACPLVKHWGTQRQRYRYVVSNTGVLKGCSTCMWVKHWGTQRQLYRYVVSNTGVLKGCSTGMWVKHWATQRQLYRYVTVVANRTQDYIPLGCVPTAAVAISWVGT